MTEEVSKWGSLTPLQAKLYKERLQSSMPFIKALLERGIVSDTEAMVQFMRERGLVFEEATMTVNDGYEADTYETVPLCDVEACVNCGAYTSSELDNSCEKCGGILCGDDCWKLTLCSSCAT